MHVLVAYGSKRASTAGLAQMISEGLSASGIEVDVRTAPDVWTLKPYHGVIVVGAVDHTRWHRDARWFVHRYADQLRALPVWLLSGPLDDPASLPEVNRLAERIGAQRCISFGGGPEQVRGFALTIVAELVSVARRAS